MLDESEGLEHIKAWLFITSRESSRQDVPVFHVLTAVDGKARQTAILLLYI